MLIGPIQLETIMFNKILVVCVGNICRSPTGERVLQKLNEGGIAVKLEKSYTKDEVIAMFSNVISHLGFVCLQNSEFLHMLIDGLA